MQVGKICLNKGFLEVLKPENKQKKSTVSVQSVENADNLTRQEEQKEENTNLDILKNLNGLATKFQDEEIKYYIKKMVDEKYSTNLLKTKYVNDSKITDHYAIIPTGQGFENYDKLPDLQKNIYKLIVRRFLAIFYPPAEYSKVQATLNIENESFYASRKNLFK